MVLVYEALGILDADSNHDCYILKISSSACMKLIKPVTIGKLSCNILLNVILWREAWLFWLMLHFMQVHVPRFTQK